MSKQKKGLDLQTLRRVLPYVKPYRLHLLTSLLCASVSAAAALLIPIFSGNAIDCMLGPGAVDAAGVDLQISGHTHHGQVFPLNLITDVMYEQSHGYRKWQHAHIYVSSGLSLWGPPFRIGTHSDMAVITLK